MHTYNIEDITRCAQICMRKRTLTHVLTERERGRERERGGGGRER